VLLIIALPLFLFALTSYAAITAIDEDAPWPRTRSTNGHTVTLHLPQVERWTSNSFQARAVVQVKPAKAKKELLGVAWFEAHGTVDRSNRVVMLDRFEVTRVSFPEATDNGSNALAIIREVIPAGARTVSLDYLVTALGFAQAAARQGASGIKHDPPQILWVTNRTKLVRIDGEPVLRPVSGTSLERVINTPALLVRDTQGNRFYLEGSGRWFAASSISGPWSLAQSPPPDVSALTTNAPTASLADEAPPQIIISTSSAELLVTAGAPDYRPIHGTKLQYVADSNCQIFYHPEERAVYLLLSGRWFKATSFKGPWNYVAPNNLPSEFAKIPANSPQAMVLSSVPETRQAEMAMIEASVPTTATVNRKSAKLQLTYDGEPKFKPISGTSMSYAVNAQVPVIKTGSDFYALDKGVWFTGKSATGPWEVATEVPEEIYTIPPTSPVYYATYARVYDSDEDSVETGYTSGYTGSYEDDGTMVYGTGYDYEPWYGDDYYYGWGWSWGYCYYYVPWWGYWTWNPGEGAAGSIRAAIIDNIYDRWSTPGITPHDRVGTTAANNARRQNLSGHPALYGRFQGATRAESLSLPANTIALNPYTRPQAGARSGEIPRGAQLLSNVRQSTGGGRDLYASPDGNVYRRQSDGWYRGQPGGKWSFAAPLQGQVQRDQAGAGRAGGQLAASGGGYRGGAGQNFGGGLGAGRANRVPDSGNRIPAAQVADLERQHYARTLSQARAQNVRSTNVSRPAVRAGGGRRR
jgi:hypothetical protein